MQHSQATTLLRQLFDKAVEVADPMHIVPKHLPEKPSGRVLVIGAGKASARMAEAVESVWNDCEGLVITRYGYARPCSGIEIVEAAHPVPDQEGERATERLLDLIKGLSEEDFVLVLVSGGASALLVAPTHGISLADKQDVNTALVASGAPIQVMNTVRKHLSRVKGGQLASAAWPASMLTLMISDVAGDDPAFIGSGPTVGDSSTVSDVLALLKHWKIDVPEKVRSALNHETGVVAPTDNRLSSVDNRVVAGAAQSLEAAANLAMEADVEVRMLGDDIEGEARSVAKHHADEALQIQNQLQAGDRPVLLLSGGELTVTIQGNGVGGPNAEYCLALAMALGGAEGVFAIACDTDGVDGAAEVAGAIIGPDTLSRSRALKLDYFGALQNNDAHSFFEKLGDQIVTGPTLTNVNDFRAILIAP